MLEQPGLELHAQHAAHRIVDLRLRHPAFADQLGKVAIALAVGRLDVDAGVERALGRVA